MPAFLHTIRRATPLFVLLLGIAGTPLVARSATDEQVVTGTWRLTAAVDGADISSLDEHQARRLLGKRFIITHEKIQFGKETCPEPSFEAKSVEPRLYVREEFRADAMNLKLPNPATVVNLGCTAAFIKTPDKLLIFWGGWFFDAVRVAAPRRR